MCQPVKGCLHRSPQCSCQCLELANCERRRIARAAASVKLQHKGVKAWKRDLTQENIELHPGRSSGRHLLLLGIETVNSGPFVSGVP